MINDRTHYFSSASKANGTPFSCPLVLVTTNVDASKPNGNLIFLLVSVTTNVDGEDIPAARKMSRISPKPMRLCSSREVFVLTIQMNQI